MLLLYTRAQHSSLDSTLRFARFFFIFRVSAIFINFTKDKMHDWRIPNAKRRRNNMKVLEYGTYVIYVQPLKQHAKIS